ncbi:MAG: hypothetical protein DHS20C15_06690 [Planctomycetota bacterium]|nr:MAG: hypothetical protein DHS20C15_06690 [Planctomycetota bacterium]
MKSHAVLSLGCGMPGVSGELKVHGVPTRGPFAKLPGEVPSAREDGLLPSWGKDGTFDALIAFLRRAPASADAR